MKGAKVTRSNVSEKALMIKNNCGSLHFFPHLELSFVCFVVPRLPNFNQGSIMNLINLGKSYNSLANVTFSLSINLWIS